MHKNGELSVTNNQAAVDASTFPLTLAEAASMASRPPVFMLRPVLGSISTQWTGLGGGTVLNVTLDPGSAAFDISNPSANQVSQHSDTCPFCRQPCCPFSTLHSTK